jgi:hypothetical protein
MTSHIFHIAMADIFHIPISPRCNYILHIPMTSPIALQDCCQNSQKHTIALADLSFANISIGITYVLYLRDGKELLPLFVGFPRTFYLGLTVHVFVV